MSSRPDELYPAVVREPVEGSCPQCGGGVDLRRYPVLSEHRWEMVVKCQACLHSVERVPWHRLGYIQLPIDALDA